MQDRYIDTQSSLIIHCEFTGHLISTIHKFMIDEELCKTMKYKALLFAESTARSINALFHRFEHLSKSRMVKKRISRLVNETDFNFKS